MKLFSTQQSLFRTILASFMILILIFCSFNLLIFWLVKKHLRSEMMAQNRLTLQKVAERYQFQLDKVREALYKQFTDKNVITLNNQVILKRDSETLSTRPIVLSLQSIASDSELYVDNIILMFRSSDLTLSKLGPGSTLDLFSSIYQSTPYPLSYWQSQFERSDNYVLHPGTVFGSPTPSGESAGRLLIPYSIKPALADNMMIAMIDANRLRDAVLKENPDLDITILGPNQTVLYETHQDTRQLPEPVDIAYQGEDGLRYVMKITSPKILRLDTLMIILLGVSIAIAYIVALFFSRRIHKPVRQLIQEKGEIQQELQDQQSELINYHFMNKLKNIHPDPDEWQHIQGTEGTYTIVLYELRFRSPAFTQVPMSREHISLTIGEQLKRLTDERFPDAHTLQMEHHQFLTVFPGNERERILHMLEEVKLVLDEDLRYCLVTAAISSAFEHSMQFGHAYRQVNELAANARLREETQIVVDYRSDRAAYLLTLTQEQELTTALKSGKEQETLDLFLPWLDELDLKEASVDMFKHMVLAVTDKAKMVLEHYKVLTDDTLQLRSILLQLEECCTLDEYKRSFEAYFRIVTHLIREKKETYDPIIDHVLNVIKDQYAEDLSLDVLADQLTLSSSYLSTYIKEKTGANFMEHLHDRRVGYAQELLIQTDSNIQDIGIQVGYRNISSFNRMFKNRTGSSPGEYRRTHLLDKRA
ncbi:helix-turn-helix domain-containing protein [Paenibacillus qinlingensis]|uniref:YesN/AraC family two-component response regulator n=1 Tax=Paenibacillus qinlingensis TaxID=1837343 RepID=A0ABU1P4I0_9BACL|nr:helix-turn-helix domain-containing protein [Paenibacillus qinlingensis]MDR6554651.1 YesN/AraC family two-component response regulator [Paenibacillus qinlingensis]